MTFTQYKLSITLCQSLNDFHNVRNVLLNSDDLESGDFDELMELLYSKQEAM